LVVVVEQSVDGGGVEHGLAIRGSQAGQWSQFRHDQSSNGIQRYNR